MERLGRDESLKETFLPASLEQTRSAYVITRNSYRPIGIAIDPPRENIETNINDNHPGDGWGG